MKNKKLLLGIGALVLVLVGGLVANSSGLLQGKVRNLRSPKSISTPSSSTSTPPPASNTTSSGSNSLAPTVDLKVNGQDGPVIVPIGPFGPFSSQSGGTSGVPLSWTSINANSCQATSSGPGWAGWNGNKNVNGQMNLYVDSPGRTFTLTCTNAEGISASDSITINVASVNLLVNNSSHIPLLGTGSSTPDFTASWSSPNMASCNASTQSGTSSWSGPRATSGSEVISNANFLSVVGTTGSWAFGLNCLSTNGVSSQDLVSVYQLPTVNLLVNGGGSAITVPQGTEVILSWTTTGAVSCNGNPSMYGSAPGWSSPTKPLNGSQAVTVTQPSTYFNLNCTSGSGASTNRSLRVDTIQPPTVDLKVNGSNGPLIAITGTGSSATGGGTVTLSWTATNATACAASSSIETYGWTGSKPTSGSAVINVPSARQFSLECLAPGVASGSDSVFVSTTIVPAPTVDLLINGEEGPVLINPGEEVVLSWTSTNALSCQATGGWSGVKTISGSQTVTPNTASGGQNFSLNCSGTAGNGYDTLRANALTVDLKVNGSNGPITATGSSASGGGTVTLSWNAPNATSATACVASSSIETVGWIGSKPTSGSAVINVPSARQFSLECLAPGVASVSDSVLVNVPE